jgi:hypothetical protein
MSAWQRCPLAGLEEDDDTLPMGGAKAPESFVRMRSLVDLGAEAPAPTWPKFPIGSSEPYAKARVTADLRRRWVVLGGRFAKFVAHVNAAEPNAGEAAYDVNLLRESAADFHALREALYEIQLDIGDPTVERLFGEHGSVSTFLVALYGWCEGTLDALEEAALVADASALCDRVDGEEHDCFTSLVPRVRAEVATLLRLLVRGVDRDAVESFAEDLEELFFAADFLHKRLTAKRS